eukprot:gene46971-59691_t
MLGQCSLPRFVLTLFATFCLSCAVHAVVCVGIDLAGKWAIVGQRQTGLCSWDQSSYCQRWQLHLGLSCVRHSCYGDKVGVLDLLGGSAWVVWYFRACGARIGSDVCLYPNGADPMMTEPDLCHIADLTRVDCIQRVTVDAASVISHMNTRGEFMLNTMRIGEGAVMRYGSRCLSGGTMEARSTLCERSLLLTGEVADEGS